VAILARIIIAELGVSVCPKVDDLPTSGTSGRFIFWWILKLFKVVFIGAIPDVYFGVE
jgi:hypothetical protein